MGPPPTRAQLQNGAQGIACRAGQLAGVARLFLGGLQVDTRIVDTVRNALVESALVNARALAWFFTDRSSRHVNASMYLSSWADDVATIARKVIAPASQHLGHASIGSPHGEEHPGAWPVPELAVVLVGGLAKFVQTRASPSSLEPCSST